MNGNTVAAMPRRTDLHYGGEWHRPKSDCYFETFSPASGQLLSRIADAGTDDVDAAVAAARQGYAVWRAVAPLERAKLMRACADAFRHHARELAWLDSIDSGAPISEMESDVQVAARAWDFFAGLVTEMKGSSIPMGPDATNFSVREPRGVVVRIAPFNHPFMFSGGRLAAPLAAGNSVISKPPEQAPLSALRMAEILEPLLPPGVVNVLPGQREAGAALVAHPGVAMVSLTGSVPTGRAVMASAAATLKPLMLELGGKNALIAFDDADPDEVARAIIRGMNFTWCGQSCGSTSRAFVHRVIYDRVVAALPGYAAHYRPGLPEDWATTMGALIDRRQHEKVLRYIAAGHDEGARLLCGGTVPSDPRLAQGCFIEPTIFVDANQTMRIAREEIFGPVLTVIPWEDEAAMIGDVNSVEYGLTCSIWTDRLERAHRTAARVEAGFIWLNAVGSHFLGAPYGGYKQSGLGREECFEELIAYTQEKNIHISLRRPDGPEAGKRPQA